MKGRSSHHARHTSSALERQTRARTCRLYLSEFQRHSGFHQHVLSYKPYLNIKIPQLVNCGILRLKLFFKNLIKRSGHYSVSSCSTQYLRCFDVNAQLSYIVRSCISSDEAPAYRDGTCIDYSYAAVSFDAGDLLAFDFHYESYV